MNVAGTWTLFDGGKVRMRAFVLKGGSEFLFKIAQMKHVPRSADTLCDYLHKLGMDLRNVIVIAPNEIRNDGGHQFPREWIRQFYNVNFAAGALSLEEYFAH